MSKRLFLTLVLFVLILSACESPSQPPTYPPALATSQPDEPLAFEPPYPLPPVSGGDTPTGAYPAPSPLQPLPNEDTLLRGEVFIDQGGLLLLESYPVRVMLNLKGSLPTPCHHLRAKVSEPNNENRIQVEVYSLSQPDELCIQVLHPFDVNIPLGSYTVGKFSVWVNGEKIGEFSL